MAVERVVDRLKEMSKPVTTPEEIAQVSDEAHNCVYELNFECLKDLLSQQK